MYWTVIFEKLMLTKTTVIIKNKQTRISFVICNTSVQGYPFQAYISMTVSNLGHK